MLTKPFGALITGIGGTGVITIGQILAMAAHLEGKGTTVLDMSGLAQKGGPVMSHVRIANSPDELHAVRVGTGGADLVIGCDLVVTASIDSLSRMNDSSTRVVVNATAAPTAAFVKNPDWQMPGSDLQSDIAAAAGAQNVALVDAGHIATALLGDAIATNMFMLGYAYQKGWVPIAESSLLKAIALNDVSVAFNQKAFAWGRRTAADPVRVEKLANPGEVIAFSKSIARSLDEIITRRAEFLTAYQDAAYAARYTTLVDRVRLAESDKTGGSELTETVARYFFKLMAYKDEYEVARLHTRPEFLQKIGAMFEGDYKIKFHLAPPLLNRADPITGEAKKSVFGPWMLPVFRVLAKCKGLRGTALDVFGYSEERRIERQLIIDYESTVTGLLGGLGRDTLNTAVAIAAIPEHIRGYGHVKAKHLKLAREREAKLLAELARAPAAKAA